jgi:type 1 glutamine amidotransferase
MARSALFLCGGWDGHRPRACVDLVAPLVERAGLTVTVSPTLDVLDDAATISAADVVVPCWTMGELAPEREAALVGAVEQGTGLAGWHGGMGDAFRAATDYQFAVGGQFVAHPGGIIDYTVEITDPDHPITRGLQEFAVRSERYYMHVDPSNHVLAQTVCDGAHAPWTAGCAMPVAWMRRHGNGRVFYCSIGHGPDDLGIPAVLEMVRRGILWAARALPDGAS